MGLVKMKKTIVIGTTLFLLLGIAFAITTDTQPQQNQIIEFENSNWNYLKGVGFIDDHTVEIINNIKFTERSRDYFLGEIK
jgi:hypothetical protein